MNLDFNYNDGGRSKYFKGDTGDCVCRAISIATGIDYKEVYDTINEMSKKERTGKRKHKVSNARSGVFRTTYQKLLESLGWEWHPTMKIGTGCTTHMRKEELPSGTIIVSLSRHLSCVIDGVVNDTYDCTRDGSRCVYGYFKKKDTKDKEKTMRKEYKPVNNFYEELEDLKKCDDAKHVIALYEDGVITFTEALKELADFNSLRVMGIIGDRYA